MKLVNYIKLFLKKALIWPYLKTSYSNGKLKSFSIKWLIIIHINKVNQNLVLSLLKFYKQETYWSFENIVNP